MDIVATPAFLPERWIQHTPGLIGPNRECTSSLFDWWVTPPMAQLRYWGGWLSGAQDEFLMAATVQNLRRLANWFTSNEEGPAMQGARGVGAGPDLSHMLNRE